MSNTYEVTKRSNGRVEVRMKKRISQHALLNEMQSNGELSAEMVKYLINNNPNAQLSVGDSFTVTSAPSVPASVSMEIDERSSKAMAKRLMDTLVKQYAPDADTAWAWMRQAHKDQEVVSHKDGTYWISTNDGYALVELEDGGIETGWYRKKGMAKQPAIERAIEARKKMVNWIEDHVQGNVSYGCFEVRILRPDEYEDQGEDATPVCDAGPLGGVECDDEDYLLSTLNELFDEATHGLTL